MVEVIVKKEACRGCQICSDICPTDVFAFDTDEQTVSVVKQEDCIGCLSCTYLCPSTAIVQLDVHHVKNFYRDLDYSVKAKRYL